MKRPFLHLILCILLPTLLFAAADTGKYWIFFKDKGPSAETRLSKAASTLTPRALARRAKTRPYDQLVDETDLAVYSGYTAKIKKMGLKPVHYSKWLNAVSVYATPSQLDQCKKLDFVQNIQPVMTGIKTLQTQTAQLDKPMVDSLAFVADYGSSQIQAKQINMITVHKAGYLGDNVLIAILDSGFNLDHYAFNDLKLVDAWDFVNHDAIVDNEEDQDVYNQADHGSRVLSIMAGYAPGELVGTAVNAEYLLAKTEDITFESRVEEDNWVAAAEWADSLGADIITTSVGYTDWYLPEHMNGLIPYITRAADMAVDKGIVVLTSAGNEGDKEWKKVSAPADGFNVISVGAVRSSGTISEFSSLGPTADGRIKPEVVALGSGVFTADAAESGYSNVDGTSYSCPLVAGAAALLLSAHPDLTPLQVREALITTASRHSNPDTVYGYGLVNTLDAINYWGQVITVPKSSDQIQSYPNPFYPDIDGLTRIVFNLDRESRVTATIYNVLGQKVTEIYNGSKPQGSDLEILWDGRKQSGAVLPSGVYLCHIKTDYNDLTQKIILLH